MASFPRKLPLSLFWFLCFAGTAALLYREHDRHRASVPADIIFPIYKAFVDRGGSVLVTGTLTGEGVEHANNQTSISCDNGDRKCSIVTVEQTGPNRIGDIAAPIVLKVVTWNSDEIIADSSDDDYFSCFHTTISLERRAESVRLVQGPINGDKARCQRSDAQTYSWTVEDSQYGKRLKIPAPGQDVKAIPQK